MMSYAKILQKIKKQLILYNFFICNCLAVKVFRHFRMLLRANKFCFFSAHLPIMACYNDMLFVSVSVKHGGSTTESECI